MSDGMDEAAGRIDNEALAGLPAAAGDPERFVALRRQLIERFLAGSPPELAGRLRELQATIDGTVAAAGTPQRAKRALVELIRDRWEAMVVVAAALRAEQQAADPARDRGGNPGGSS